MGDLAKSRKCLQGAMPKSWKMREKCHFARKIGKNSRNDPGCIFAIFDGFGPILMIFIDQSMPIHDFLVSEGIFD